MKENTRLTLGSLFDGSGGFPLAGLLCGITPVWASEIEPFPIRVTTKRLPFMKHYGDISQMDGGRIEPVDIITFGSPCTDMSIAGKRSGLDGQQSVLFYQAIRIIKEMRCATNGKYPRYICWENVPGAFSSNKGEDFKAVLDAVIGVIEPDAQVPMPEKNLWPYADIYMGDGWSLAYRTLDAQYWGVPQRRKRIFLVADFAADSAGQILFESEGLSGYSAESFRSWQRTAGSAAACAGAAGGICLNDQGGIRMEVSHEVAGTLRAETHGHAPCVVDAAGFNTEHSAESRSIGYEEERSPTIRAGKVPAAVYFSGKGRPHRGAAPSNAGLLHEGRDLSPAEDKKHRPSRLLDARTQNRKGPVDPGAADRSKQHLLYQQDSVRTLWRKLPQTVSETAMSQTIRNLAMRIRRKLRKHQHLRRYAQIPRGGSNGGSRISRKPFP